MKLKTVFARILIALTIVVSFQSVLNAQTTYPMVCRGGGNMKLILTGRSDGTRMDVRFRKGPRAYDFDQANLQPGECAWTDRAINSREPTLFRWDVRARVFVEFRAFGPGIVNARIESNGDSGISKAEFFLRTVRSGGYFTVNAFNTRRGYFQITSIQEGS